jgi:hypothetical protein
VERGKQLRVAEQAARRTTGRDEGEHQAGPCVGLLGIDLEQPDVGLRGAVMIAR